jgi:hypothetical protein
MRTWIKVGIGVVIAGVVAFGALAGTGAYFFLRHLDTGTATETDTRRDFDAIRTRYGSRPPLVQIVDLKTADIRVERAAHPEGRRAHTLHVLTWKPESGDRLSTDVPLWLMRFSSVNVLSHLGLAPEKYRLTAEDVMRYGPGIVVDYRPPGQDHVLIWVE